MAKNSTVKMDIEKLKALAESLKTVPHIEVGVFASKSARKDVLTNATLAAIHEYGDPRHNLPPRSMLYTPIKDHAKEIMKSMKERAHELIDSGKVANTWKLIGIAAEKVVLGAFATNGYGKWAPLSPSTIAGKFGRLSGKKLKDARTLMYTGQKTMATLFSTLIQTGQLRRAFSSRVRMGYR